MQKHLHIAIPLLDELENLDALFENLKQQNYKYFSVYLCVNQPDNYWDNADNIEICKRNQESIKYIIKEKELQEFPIYLIDKSSKGKGWKGKKLGVGWARKVLMSEIETNAQKEDLVISLDGDTEFNSNYFDSIQKNFQENKTIDCLSIPYYHPLNNDELANRVILRYEIYMRYYLLNLMRIESPYAFSALGSAIAFRLGAMQKIGGFTPKKSGEDFYFIQKMIKYKAIGNWNTEKVYPAARFSDRVFFGTGPAMIKGKSGDWDSYPLYPMHLFDNIKEFYNLIPKLYIRDCKTPIDNFLGSEKQREILFAKLRKNNKDLAHFTKAIHDYFDGLRILQYLKQEYLPAKEEKNLIDFLLSDFAKGIDSSHLISLCFENSSILQLNEIRDYLCKLEDINRQRINA